MSITEQIAAGVFFTSLSTSLSVIFFVLSKLEKQELSIIDTINNNIKRKKDVINQIVCAKLIKFA